MSQFRHARCALAAACLLAVAPFTAVAQVTPTVAMPAVPHAPFLGDHVGIRAWNGMCPEPYFDIGQAPQIRQTSHTVGQGGVQQDTYEHELTYFMKASEICLSPTPPAMPSANLIDIGALPQGLHTIAVQGIDEEDEVFVEYEVVVYVGPADDLRADASGIWFAPEQNGRGVTVARANGLAVIYWATHDAQGDPAWNVLTASIDPASDTRNIVSGTALTTHGDPLAPGAATLEAEAWGAVAFEYLGCGKARLEWNANDAGIEDGALELVQILQPDGVEFCDVAGSPTRVEAQWID